MISEKIYKVWHPLVEQRIEAKSMALEKCHTNKVAYFNCDTFHCGSRAVKSGWRWFGRLTFNSKLEPKNEIRKQVQIYMDNPYEGW